ncbi:hypothetical protein NKH18_03460 [Streptomyces sp. M10(2022)]
MADLPDRFIGVLLDGLRAPARRSWPSTLLAAARSNEFFQATHSL